MQTHWLTQTKFIPPRLREDYVPRRRLLDALCTAVTVSPLTLVSAPAGYGKTTLLVTLYAQLSGKAVVWLALDEDDNDPVRFLMALVTALQKLQPQFGENLKVLLTSVGQPASEMRRVISVLINEMMAKCPEAWLLLDDLNLITEPAVYTALDYLLERLPPQVHLLIGTRYDPPLALARLRARGQLAEVRVAMLDELRDRVIAYLAQNRVYVICTSGAGSPWAVTTQYTNCRLELACQAPRWANALFHLEHDPHALVIVLGAPTAPLCWLEYRGLARLVDSADDRYVTVHLTPQRIDLIDERRGWGVRETLDL